MYSGGLDSYILKHVFSVSDEECLFVRMGTEENKIEEEYIKRYSPKVQIVELPIACFELENKIIPFRNHFLCLLAAQYACNILFAFTAGDTTRDKDFVFQQQMEEAMNYFALSKDKVHFPGPYQVFMLFKHLTKTEIVKSFLNTGFDGEDLIYKSISCYSGAEIGCGQCRSCLRKYVALHNADKELGEKCRKAFDHDPKEFIPIFLQESIRKGRNKKEIEEIKEVL